MGTENSALSPQALPIRNLALRPVKKENAMSQRAELTAEHFMRVFEDGYRVPDKTEILLLTCKEGKEYFVIKTGIYIIPTLEQFQHFESKNEFIYQKLNNVNKIARNNKS